MADTKIEWTDSVWNPVTGCTKVSDGCRNCYAQRMAQRLKDRHGYPADDPFRVTLHPERLEEPLRWRKRRRVFVCSMGDLFHEAVPSAYIARVWQRMRDVGGGLDALGHTWIVLTKRPARMRSWLANCGNGGGRGWITHNGDDPTSHGGTGIIVGDAHRWPLPDVWLGVSAEDQATLDERVPLLLDTPAAVRFVSLEPLLGPVDLRSGTVDRLTGQATWLPGVGSPADRRVDWVIVGGESGPCARTCDVAWIRSVVRQGREAGVPVFVKQLGRTCRMSRGDAFQPVACGAGWNANKPGGNQGEVQFVDLKGSDPTEWPEDLRIREWPAAGRDVVEVEDA